MRAAIVVALTCTFSVLGPAVQAQEPAPIADNSFLIEEAYNQEARVVQHINTFFLVSGEWIYSFTQEWPVRGQRSQFSYTIPVLSGAFGDVALNYRFQAVGPGNLAFSPRVTLVLPTGSWERERGHGVVGYQVNLPLSARLGKRVVTHWNAGSTLYPDAPTLDGVERPVWVYAVGGSAIFEVRPTFNLMLEVTWGHTDDLVGPTVVTEEMFINPGIRWAHNLSGMQIVPGISVPIGVGPSRGTTAVFLYLSLEHGF